MIIQRISLFLLLFSLPAISLAGCKSTIDGGEPAGNTVSDKRAGKDEAAGAESIKIFNSDGKPIFKLREKDFGYKLFAVTGGDPYNEQPIAKVRLGDAFVIVEDLNGNGIYKLVGSAQSEIRIEDGQGSLLYRIKPEDRAFILEDQNQRLVCSIKQEDYGYRVTDEKEQLLFKVKRENSRVVIESTSGKAAMEVKGIDNLQAVSALALERLDERQRAALMILLYRKGIVQKS
jgi:hypothetical protein